MWHLGRDFFFSCLQPVRDVAGSETQALLWRLSSPPLPQEPEGTKRGGEMLSSRHREGCWWELLYPAHLLALSDGELG